jgi:hypothetical protein
MDELRKKSKDRGPETFKLCEISAGGYIDNRHVRGIERLDTLGNLVICEKNRAEFLSKILGIKNIPSKAAFARVLSIVGGRQVEARQFIGAE